MLRNRLGWGLVFVVFGGALFGWAQDQSRDSGKRDPKSPATQEPATQEGVQLSEFMRKKLAASNKILEGLCTEDLALVKEGAQSLNEISAAERFRVSNDPLYRQFHADFRTLTQALIQAAEDNNTDRVALKWMDATMSCLDCHQFVRGMRLAGVNP